MSRVTPPDTRESDAANPSSSEDATPAVLAGSRVVSTLRAASRRVGSWVRNSALYQWLTAEPDPEVIVIDLRDTWTVGPLLRILDWVLGRLVDAADGSRSIAAARRGAAGISAAPIRAGGLLIATIGLVVAASSFLDGLSTVRLGVGVGGMVAGLVAMQDDRDWATLRATRPVELLIAAFEPPEPPADSPHESSDEQADGAKNGPQEVASRDGDRDDPVDNR